jgi:peroxiredoxin
LFVSAGCAYNLHGTTDMLLRSRFGPLFLILALIACFYFGRDRNLNQPAPAFLLPETDGGQVDLASYAGRPVLLVFWSSSCSICQRELPMLNRLEPELRGKGVAVVTILIGGEGEARDYMSSNRIGLKSLYDADGTVARAYRVGGIPKLVLIGADGKVKRSSSGFTDESVLLHWADGVS